MPHAYKHKIHSEWWDVITQSYCLCGNALTLLAAFTRSNRQRELFSTRGEQIEKNKCKTRKKNGIICKCRCPYICTNKMLHAAHGHRQPYSVPHCLNSSRIFTKYNSNCRYNLIKYYPELFFHSALWVCVCRVFCFSMILCVVFLSFAFSSLLLLWLSVSCPVHLIRLFAFEHFYCGSHILHTVSEAFWILVWTFFSIRCHCFAGENVCGVTPKNVRNHSEFSQWNSHIFFEEIQVIYCESGIDW